MNITGTENLLFGVEDMEACRRFLTTYGLVEIPSEGQGAKFRALDGSGVDLRPMDDPDLPAAQAPGATLRATIWGVKGREDLDAIADELSKDRQIIWVDDVLQSTDDDGHAIHFRVTQRVPYASAVPPHNLPGREAVRFNKRVDFDTHGPARQLGHIVYWSPDAARSMAFYTDRLGFRVTDSYTQNAGIFARAAAHPDHHSLFFITNPQVPPGFQHVEFTFGDFQEVMIGGHKLSKAGYETLMGPGRFELGSNWYWYFFTPMGGAFELGADIDQIDDEWQAGVFEFPTGAPGWSLSFNRERSRA